MPHVNTGRRDKDGKVIWSMRGRTFTRVRSDDGSYRYEPRGQSRRRVLRGGDEVRPLERAALRVLDVKSQEDFATSVNDFLQEADAALTENDYHARMVEVIHMMVERALETSTTCTVVRTVLLKFFIAHSDRIEQLIKTAAATRNRNDVECLLYAFQTVQSELSDKKKDRYKTPDGTYDFVTVNTQLEMTFFKIAVLQLYCHIVSPPTTYEHVTERIRNMSDYKLACIRFYLDGSVHPLTREVFSEMRSLVSGFASEEIMVNDFHHMRGLRRGPDRDRGGVYVMHPGGQYLQDVKDIQDARDVAAITPERHPYCGANFLDPTDRTAVWMRSEEYRPDGPVKEGGGSRNRRRRPKASAAASGRERVVHS